MNKHKTSKGIDQRDNAVEENKCGKVSPIKRDSVPGARSTKDTNPSKHKVPKKG
jgi:hypothetical protein